MDIERIKRIVEAALLAAGQPLSLVALTALFGENEVVTSDQVAQALTELGQDYESRGIELVEVASGFRVQVRQDVHPWVARLWTERQTKYSRALLETLALIAYRQPITRAEIEQIRGVAVSTHIIKTLEEREWVRVVGHRDVPGRPALFGTTRQFLDYFNLKSLDQLPPLSEIRDIEDFEPQLELPNPDGIVAMTAQVEIQDDVASSEADVGRDADDELPIPDNVVPLHPRQEIDADDEAEDDAVSLDATDGVENDIADEDDRERVAEGLDVGTTATNEGEHEDEIDDVANDDAGQDDIGVTDANVDDVDAIDTDAVEIDTVDMDIVDTNIADTHIVDRNEDDDARVVEQIPGDDVAASETHENQDGDDTAAENKA